MLINALECLNLLARGASADRPSGDNRGRFQSVTQRGGGGGGGVSLRGNPRSMGGLYGF